MKIPDKILLSGIPISTVFESGVNTDDANIHGLAVYKQQQIKLWIDNLGKEVSEQTYVHELTHHILFMMGEHKLRNSEKFVDLLAFYIHQIINQLTTE